MNLITFKNNIPSTEKVLFDGVTITSPIRRAIPRAFAQFADRMLVIFQFPDSPFKDLPTDNCFAFDRSGKILWRIRSLGSYEPMFLLHYEGFAIHPKNKRLMIANIDGNTYYPNLFTGDVVRVREGE